MNFGKHAFIGCNGDQRRKYHINGSSNDIKEEVMLRLLCQDLSHIKSNDKDIENWQKMCAESSKYKMSLNESYIQVRKFQITQYGSFFLYFAKCV